MSARMHTMLALALATPFWGFALTPPTVAAPSLLPDSVAQVHAQVSPADGDDAAALGTSATADANQLALHHTLYDWTSGLQVASTVGLAVTSVLGALQFDDEYGFHSSYSQTRCATNTATLGFCGEQMPWPHAIASTTTGILQLGALITSYFVPDVWTAEEISSGRRDRWRVYEVTRWIEFAMSAVQAVGGFFLANAQAFGWLSYSQDFGTMQSLAIAHEVFGLTTTAMSAVNSALLVW